VTNAIVTNDSPEKLADHFGEYFDRILLDAPCSGEGMFRKSATARQEWNTFVVNSCAIRQSAILEQAARMLKFGGHLAYTTCTFSVEENEGVITRFLSQHPEFELAPIPPAVGFQPVMPEWVGLPSENNLKHAIRIWPHLSQGEGHFIALLVKQGSSNTILQPGKFPLVPNSHQKTRLSKTSRDLLDEFCQANLDVVFDVSRLIQIGSYVYLVPEYSPDLSGLNVTRLGWWLVTINKGRFTPSHSLALGIKTAQARRNYPLQVGDQLLSGYLRGESISSPGDDGWILISVDGFPIGWGKRVRNVIKNFYPRGLRWLS
jgi:NOL1/NOP2/fmu family ribosome biogenesis protein